MIQGIIQILILDTGIKTAIGQNKAALKYKVFPVLADVDETTPFSVCSISNIEPDNSKNCPHKLDKVFFDVVTYTKDDYELLDNIDNQIRFALDEYRGVAAGIEIGQVKFTGTRDLFDNVRGYYARSATFWAFVKRSSVD